MTKSFKLSYLKKLNYRHYICALITLGFIACSVFLFPNALGRLIESGRDFGLSIAYYFCDLFGAPFPFTITVNELPQIPFFSFIGGSSPTTSLPETFQGFADGWSRYWQVFATWDNLVNYLIFLADKMYILCQILLIIVPFILIVYIFLYRYFKNENNDYDKDSKPLKVFKTISQKTYLPVKRWLISFIDFVKFNKTYWIIWAVIWCFNFNFITIFIEFLAFYFYFVISFDFVNIYRQVYKLFLDLWAVFDFVPVWAWVIFGLFLFDRFRKKIAYARLNHFEMRNRGFINERPIVLLVCGTMGKKKTTAMTDMALSQEVMFRDKAFEKILENDLKFPYFPFINLENSIKTAMEYHEVYNLATVRKLIAKKKARYYKAPCREKLFNYDYERYGFTYDDKLKVVDIWEVVETYAQLYFIYLIQSSLLISNYSVRVDSLLSDLGNFPLWNGDFFRRDSRLIDSYSRHAHIIDFDSLRLGRKVVENNRKADCFDFGVILITEVGKERGNAVELAEKKKKDDTTNQKNDLFNASLKMIRHSATVDNFPFVKVITDEQRPESWGADARDLTEIVHIRDSGESRLAMPFYSLESLIYELVFSKFADLYYKYRYVRSDNTLPMYLLKSLTAKIRNYHLRTNNLFGFCQLGIQVESGTQDGELDSKKYYLMSKKIYSKRFSTDCFSDFFAEKNLRSDIGIDDLEEYGTEKATFSELQQQNSYFVKDLLNGLIDKDK